ncbi:unnamed protein product [Rhizophagus irregularis]|nr:unnamed protein product [Rhizophagus irregularis]CAB5363304.1 unnamed protein product [Rhizophagus irregularis]
MTYRIKEGHLGSSFESIGSNHHRPPPLVTEQVLREKLLLTLPERIQNTSLRIKMQPSLLMIRLKLI